MQLTKPADVLAQLKNERKHLEKIFVIFFLDSNKDTIKFYKRNININIANLNKLFISAFHLNAKFVIFTKVMPKRKNLIPKKCEHKLLLKLNSYSTLGIRLLDFLIISKTQYLSFHENGII